MAICKMVAQKRCSDRWDAVVGRIGHVSHHLGSLLGAIDEFTILCAFVCRVGYNISSLQFLSVMRCLKVSGAN
jgi:hypothetical protein